MKDLKKQAEDIDLMIERMDEQVKSQTREYRNELTQIEVCLRIHTTSLSYCKLQIIASTMRNW